MVEQAMIAFPAASETTVSTAEPETIDYMVAQVTTASLAARATTD